MLGLETAAAMVSWLIASLFSIYSTSYTMSSKLQLAPLTIYVTIKKGFIILMVCMYVK